MEEERVEFTIRQNFSTYTIFTWDFVDGYSHLQTTDRNNTQRNPLNALDIATGTADIAIKLASIPNCKVVGIDISEQMLDVGRKKIKKKNLEKLVFLENGDAEDLHYNDNTSLKCNYIYFLCIFYRLYL